MFISVVSIHPHASLLPSQHSLFCPFYISVSKRHNFLPVPSMLHPPSYIMCCGTLVTLVKAHLMVARSSCCDSTYSYHCWSLPRACQRIMYTVCLCVNQGYGSVKNAIVAQSNTPRFHKVRDQGSIPTTGYVFFNWLRMLLFSTAVNPVPLWRFGVA